jgi:hypothetical protein
MQRLELLRGLGIANLMKFIRTKRLELLRGLGIANFKKNGLCDRSCSFMLYFS